jgi:hypothetical protein
MFKSSVDAAVIVNQVVVVIPHACRRPAFCCIGGVRIGGGHLVLAMRRLLYGVLHFKLGKVLAHRSIDLRGLSQLLSRACYEVYASCLNMFAIMMQAKAT